MHSLDWDITSEYNLTITSQSLDFVLFKDSIWQDRDSCNFEDGTSFTVNFLTLYGQYLTLLALSKHFITRRYSLRNDGYVSGYDLDSKPFSLSVNNTAVFLNGKYVNPTCYTITENYIRFHIKGERKPGTTDLKDYVSWQEGDIVKFISNDTTQQDDHFHHYFLDFTINESALVMSQNGKHFRSAATPQLNKGKILVLVNGEIIPYKELSFPGGDYSTNVDSSRLQALVIKRNLSEADKVTIFYFDDGFEHFEYAPKSGQTRFSNPDLYGNFLTYSSEEGAGIAQLFEFSLDNEGNVIHNAVPWSNITGVYNGCRLHASCVYNGVAYNGEAEIQDSIVDKSYVAVKIISDFGRKEFDSSEWYISPARSKDIVSYLDGRTRDTVAIPEILESFQLFFINYYQDALRRLTHIRNVNEVEPDLLMPTLDMLGMRLDMSKMSELNKRRAIREVINFYKRCGTKQSVNFLGYINDKVINLEDALWTDDYIHFSTPEELGATYERKQLAQFIDYRFIAATPVAFDDYGDCLDLKGPFVITAEGNKITVQYGSRAFFPNHYTGTEGSMKWNLIPEKLEVISDDYQAGDLFLIVCDDHGVQSLDLVENIPTSSEEEIDVTKYKYYYNEIYNSINSVYDLEISVSAPLAKVHIDINDYTITILQEYKTCSYIDDYIFTMTSTPIVDPITGAKLQTGLAYGFQTIDIDGFVLDHWVELSKSQVTNIKNAKSKNLLAFFNKSNNVDSLNSSNLDYLPESYYTRTGILPEVANRALWHLANTWYVYDNYAVGPDKFECTLNEDGTVLRDEYGLAIVRDVVKDAWYRCVFIGDFEELPSVETELEIDKIPNVFYAFSNELATVKTVFILNKTPTVGETVYSSANAQFKFGTVERILSDNRIVVNSVTYTSSKDKNVDGRPVCLLDGVYYVLAKRTTWEGDSGHEYTDGTSRVYALTDNPLVTDKVYTYSNEKRNVYIIVEIDERLDRICVCPEEYYNTSNQAEHSKWYIKSKVYDEETESYVDVIVYNYYWTYDRATYWSEITRYFTDYSVAYAAKEEKLRISDFYKGIHISGLDCEIYFQESIPSDGLNAYTKNGNTFYYFGNAKSISGSQLTVIPDEQYNVYNASSGYYLLSHQNIVDFEKMKVYVGSRKWDIISVREEQSELLSNVHICYVIKNGDDKGNIVSEFDGGDYVTYSINNEEFSINVATINKESSNNYYLFIFGEKCSIVTTEVELSDFALNKNAFVFFPTAKRSKIANVVLIAKESVNDNQKWCLRFGDGTYGNVPADETVLRILFEQTVCEIDPTVRYNGYYFGSSDGPTSAWTRYSVHLLNKEEKIPHYYISYEIAGESGHLKPFIPYFNKEIYYDAINMKHYQFINGAWNEVSMVVVGELSRDGKTSDSGHSYEDNFSVSGNTKERYYLKNQSLLNEKSFKIFVDNVEWNVIFEGLDSQEPDSRVALFTKDSSYNWYFVFGDNVHGKKPAIGTNVVITYSSYEFPIMDKFLPYEKHYTDLHLVDHKIGYKKTSVNKWVEDIEKEDPIPESGYRFEKFVNPERIDLDSISIFVNKVQWNVVNSKNNYGPNDRVAEIRTAHTSEGVFVYVLFGNNVHGKNLKKADLIEIYYKITGEDLINNRWYLRYSTFQHALDTRVAYDYGSISQTNDAEWVYYRNFNPPVGYYPTNHVRFNISANGVVDASDFASEAKYQFYELASTPWVLENICNVIEFNDFFVGVGAVSKEVGSLFFRAAETLGKISIDTKKEESIVKAYNPNIEDRFYVVNNGTLGGLTNIKELKFILPYVDNDGVEYEYLVYTTTNGGYTKYAIQTSRLPSISPHQQFTLNKGDVVYASKQCKFEALVNTQGFDNINLLLDFENDDSQFIVKEYTKTCNFKVNVTSENTRQADAIELYVAGKKVSSGTITQIHLCDGQTIDVTVVAKQRGCADITKVVTLDMSMFNNEQSLYVEDLVLRKIDIHLVFCGPDVTSKVVVNGVSYTGTKELTVKYGTRITAYAQDSKYLPATEAQTVNFDALEDSIYYLDLSLKYYKLKVSTTVNGNPDTNQPIYLNGKKYEYEAVWVLGDVVNIVAGGQLNRTRVVSQNFTIVENESANAVVVECPILTEQDIDCDMRS